MMGTVRLWKRVLEIAHGSCGRTSDWLNRTMESVRVDVGETKQMISEMRNDRKTTKMSEAPPDAWNIIVAHFDLGTDRPVRVDAAPAGAGFAWKNDTSEDKQTASFVEQFLGPNVLLPPDELYWSNVCGNHNFLSVKTGQLPVHVSGGTDVCLLACDPARTGSPQTHLVGVVELKKDVMKDLPRNERQAKLQLLCASILSQVCVVWQALGIAALHTAAAPFRSTRSWLC